MCQHTYDMPNGTGNFPSVVVVKFQNLRVLKVFEIRRVTMCHQWYSFNDSAKTIRDIKNGQMFFENVLKRRETQMVGYQQVR